MNKENLVELVRMYAYQCPNVLIGLAGVLVSVLWWKRARGAAACTLVACLLLLASAAVFPACNFALWRDTNEMTIEARQRVAMVISALWTLSHSGALALLLIGVFVGRASPKPAAVTAAPPILPVV